jgi:hypothetical protein
LQFECIRVPVWSARARSCDPARRSAFESGPQLDVVRLDCVSEGANDNGRAVLIEIVKMLTAMTRR